MRHDLHPDTRSDTWIQLDVLNPDKLTSACVQIAELIDNGQVIDRVEQMGQSSYRARLHSWQRVHTDKKKRERR